MTSAKTASGKTFYVVYAQRDTVTEVKQTTTHKITNDDPALYFLKDECLKNALRHLFAAPALLTDYLKRSPDIKKFVSYPC